MTKSADEIQPLITAIKTHTKSDMATSGAIALLNVVPFAGGAIASIIGEVANERRFEKVCDVLSDLNDRLEKHGAEPEQHLSKDQIVEVVHETLQTVTTSSDDRKIEALKHGLAYAFLSEDVFQRKQLFLHVLRGCTSLELIMLPVLYDNGDPFVLYEKPDPVDSMFFRSGVVTTTTVWLNPTAFGYWEPIGNKEQCGEESLLAFLAKRSRMDEGATEGAVRLLDAKGLSSAASNLQRKDCKVFLWRESSNSFFSSKVNVSGNVLVPLPPSLVKPTPLEASRTRFGKDFLGFCRAY